MQKLANYLLLGAAAAVLTGCGGSGGSSAFSQTRIVAGYVYVENNNGIDAGPSVIVAPTSTAPDGYFKPTDGNLNLSVTNGDITRAPDSTNFDLSVSNEIIASVESNDQSPSFDVSGSGFELDGQSKGNLGSTNHSLGLPATNGTVLGLTVNAPGVYTPGAIAAIRVAIRDNGSGNGIFGAPEDILTDGLISGNTYSIAVVGLDANGVVVTGASPTVVSDNAAVVVGGSTLLTPATGTGAAAGAVNITSDFGGAVSHNLLSDFNYGTITNVSLAPTGPTDLLWNTGVAAVATINYTATVTNEFNAPVPGATVNFTGNKLIANVWDTTTGGAGFAPASNSTGNNGQVATVLSAPTSVNGVLAGADKNPKGAGTLTATAGSVSGNASINVTRPLASVSITGPSRLDVGTSSSTTVGSGQRYVITGGLDVDNDVVAAPTGATTWSVANVAGAGNIGDLDDLTAQSTSVSSINAGTGQVTAGAIAGQIDVSVTVGGTPSNVITTEVFGAPTKLVYTPATAANGYTGTQIGVVFDLMDNWGHLIPTNEYTFTKSGTADSLSGAQFTNQAGRAFDITAGSGAGTFTLTVNGTWTGAQGGSAPIAKTRTTDINP